MTQDQIVTWFYQNWPSVGIAAMMTVTYIRLWRFNRKVNILTGRLNRLMNVCAERHPERGAELYKDGLED